MHDLAGRYPGNYLFPLEEANLLRASGHAPEAAAGYRKVWQNGREGKYGNLHYEMAAWGLGELMRSQKEYAGAAVAYEQMSQAPHPDPELLQKANLAAGEMYDLLQKRDLAHEEVRSRDCDKLQHAARGGGQKAHERGVPEQLKTFQIVHTLRPQRLKPLRVGAGSSRHD